jgi:serine protein kinase
MLKCDEKFLWHLLSLSQEGNFKAGRFALISADETELMWLSKNPLKGDFVMQ